MHEAENTGVVKKAYDAFARRDIQGILDTLHADVTWKPITGAGPAVPMAGQRRGKAAVAEFFGVLADSLTFETFQPKEFVAQGDRVVVLGDYRGKTKVGRGFASDWVMVFTFRDGKISEFQEFTDVVALTAAFERVSA